MKRTNLFSLSLLALVMTSCATPIEQAKSIKISRDDPSKECKHVGSVVASSFGKDDKEADIKARLEERAMAKGGNYIKLETLDGKGGMTGQAYRCP